MPELYQPDVLDSFELGWKFRSSSGQMTFNGAIYHMEWTDFQTSIYDLLISPLIFRANAGNAEVDGIEAELNTLLTPSDAGFGRNVQSGQLTEDFNSTVDPDVVGRLVGGAYPTHQNSDLPVMPDIRNQTANWNGFAHISIHTRRMWISYH